jgi:carbon storage regulator CsrA
MLVLSRHVGEAVCVGPGVVIRVIDARGNRVRLSIDAPQDVRIVRSELLLEQSPAAHPALRSAGSGGIPVLPIARSESLPE